MHSYKFLLFTTVIVSLCRTIRNQRMVPEHLSNASLEVVAEYRLPKDVIPMYYTISIVPYFNNFTFQGNNQINVIVLQSTDKIVLNYRGLDIDRFQVVKKGGSVIKIRNIIYWAKREMVVMELSSYIHPGNYTIHTSFRGVMAKYKKGFLKTFYLTESGEQRWLVYTHFQAMFARSVFPCFDEPALKAQFKIRVAHFANQTALSNMDPQHTSSPDHKIGHRVWTEFKTTPLMSTYLVAIIVSDFRYLETKNHLFQLWARPNAIKQFEHALTLVDPVYNTLQNLVSFNMTEVMHRFKLFAVPDFVVYGMENWGLIFFKESGVMTSANTTRIENYKVLTELLSHELAHQWFGNLVTPEWWSYLWINEGFATLMEYYIPHQLFPYDGYMDDFILKHVSFALISDAETTSHHLNSNIETSSDAEKNFDPTSYSKAASLLRMILHMVGEPTFSRSLTYYITKNAFRNVEAYEFLRSIQIVCKYVSSCKERSIERIKQYMGSWMNQEGYPLITVTRNYHHATATITQERFLNDGRNEAIVKNYIWMIPLHYTTQSLNDFDDTRTMNWLTSEKTTLTIPASSKEWVIFNKQYTGFYRVNYDVQNWNMIIDYLKSSNYKNIHALNRAQLLQDSFQLAMSGYLNYSVTFSLASYLVHETDYAPWVTACKELTTLSSKLEYTPMDDILKTYVNNLIKPIERRLTYKESETDSKLVKVLRSKILDVACAVGSENCTRHAEQYLLDYYNSPNPDTYVVTPNLKKWIFCRGLERANSSVWHFLHDRAFKTNVQQEQNIIFQSLSCTRNKELYKEYLTLLLKNNRNIKPGVLLTVFQAMVNNPKMSDVLLKFFVQNRPLINAIFNEKLNSFFNLLAQKLNTKEQLDKLKEFLIVNSNMLQLKKDDVTLIMAQVHNNIIWFETYGKSIQESLKTEIHKMKNRATIFLNNLWFIISLITVVKFIS